MTQESVNKGVIEEATEPSTVPQVAEADTLLAPPQPVPATARKHTFVIIGISFFLFLAFAVLVRSVGLQLYSSMVKNLRFETAQLSQTETTPLPELGDSVTGATGSGVASDNEKKEIGATTWSFAEVEGNIYIKRTISGKIEKPISPDINAGPQTVVYAEDIDRDPQIVQDLNVSDDSWIELLIDPIYDFNYIKTHSIGDELFSFKRIPGSKSFLFVLMPDRGYQTYMYPGWSGDRDVRTLYFYDADRTSASLSKIATFEEKANSDEFTYPKISSISTDQQYAAIELYGCWGCQGHDPQLFLVNLKTLETKNIGYVYNFVWKDDGNYAYQTAEISPDSKNGPDNPCDYNAPAEECETTLIYSDQSGKM